MILMKMVDKKKKTRVVELLKAGAVLFDPRPDWLLITPDIGKRRNTDLWWVHSSEVEVEWIRKFSF